MYVYSLCYSPDWWAASKQVLQQQRMSDALVKIQMVFFKYRLRLHVCLLKVVRRRTLKDNDDCLCTFSNTKQMWHKMGCMTVRYWLSFHYTYVSFYCLSSCLLLEISGKPYVIWFYSCFIYFLCTFFPPFVLNLWRLYNRLLVVTHLDRSFVFDT